VSDFKPARRLDGGIVPVIDAPHAGNAPELDVTRWRAICPIQLEERGLHEPKALHALPYPTQVPLPFRPALIEKEMSLV
jgi:hypothetical protein